jgi:hypothetical protein
MTMSEFDTLRSDLAGLRADVTAWRADMDRRLSRLEAKIDEKPGAATIYQASLATFAGMFAVVVGTVLLLKTTGITP